MGVDDVVVPERLRRLGAEDLAREDAELAGSWSLVSPSKGPACTLGTCTPSAIGTTGSSRLLVARVKMSTSMPRAASRRATSTT